MCVCVWCVCVCVWTEKKRATVHQNLRVKRRIFLIFLCLEKVDVISEKKCTHWPWVVREKINSTMEYSYFLYWNMKKDATFMCITIKIKMQRGLLAVIMDFYFHAFYQVIMVHTLWNLCIFTYIDLCRFRVYDFPSCEAALVHNLHLKQRVTFKRKSIFSTFANLRVIVLL